MVILFGLVINHLMIKSREMLLQEYERCGSQAQWYSVMSSSESVS
jgi:hypothetical protein